MACLLFSACPSLLAGEGFLQAVYHFCVMQGYLMLSASTEKGKERRSEPSVTFSSPFQQTSGAQDLRKPLRITAYLWPLRAPKTHLSTTGGRHFNMT